MRFCAAITIFLLMTLSFKSYAQGVALDTTIDADQFVYDNESEVVMAKGNVVFEQGDQMLKADSIIYNVRDDLAIAKGNILFIDKDGTQSHADLLELSDNMRRGVAHQLFSVLDDGARMWAQSAERKSPEKHVLKDAKYTPCKACENDPNKTPPWALVASKVTHDKKNAEINYNNVRFEAWGTPILYTPYFSHPDGSVNQKSGFLTPEFGFGSDLGANFMMPYYWAIAPDIDATIGVRAYARAMPQLNFEIRKQYNDALVQFDGSTTYSDRTDSINGVETNIDDEFRGHFRANALWNINNKWRAGGDIYLASDKQYLDQYDIDDEDVLENRIYVERFDNRDYASVELIGFQDLRLDQDVDQPNALPLANAMFVGKPNSFLGGRLMSDSSFLTLYRAGDDQDVGRLSSSLAWKRSDVLPAGIKIENNLSLRGDAYYSRDRTVAKVDPTEDNNKFDNRLIPTAHIEVSYPLQKPLRTSQIKIKPRVSLTVRPDIDNDSDIPNEDSQDAQIDYINLFEADRFPGLDRVEDRTHVNYGIEGGYYTQNGDEFTFGLGQSYRFESEDNPFRPGSGFENDQSDIVGQIGASFNKHRHNLNYRFQVDGQKYTADRHEFYGSTKIGKTSLSSAYLYERGELGTEFEESREQIQAKISQKLNDKWRVSTSALYDLGNDSGLRKSTISASYDDDCYGVTAELQRDLQRDATGGDDTSLFLRLRLKNLGEFEASAYNLSGDQNENILEGMAP